MNVIKKNKIIFVVLSGLFWFIILLSLLMLLYYSNPHNSYFPINPHFSSFADQFFDILHPQIYYSLFVFQTCFYYFFLGMFVLCILKQFKVFDRYLKLFSIALSLLLVVKLFFIFLELKSNKTIHVDKAIDCGIIIVILISLLFYKKGENLNSTDNIIPSKRTNLILPILSLTIFILIIFLDSSRQENEKLSITISDQINMIVEQNSKLVKIGMNESKVIHIMGKPFRRYKEQNRVSLMYVLETQHFGESDIKKDMEIIFENGICKKINIREVKNQFYYL